MHREVAGNFAYLLDPNNYHEWCELICNEKIKKPSEKLGKKEYLKAKKITFL